MSMTIQQAIDKIIAAVPHAPFPQTVDTVKLGDTTQPITNIVVTFLATSAVIEQASQLGANLIIAHEPLFYNHLDKTDKLSTDSVYQAKRQLIEKNKLVVWRFHDYLHSLEPDSTQVGLGAALGWEANALTEQPFLYDIPSMTLLELSEWVKQRLGIRTMRVVGDLAMPCARVALLPGFPGHQIEILGINGVDVLITGEIHEWEVNEYVRDATHLGFKKGLIVTGHEASEEPGMKWIMSWLQQQLPEVAMHYVATGSPFHQL